MRQLVGPEVHACLTTLNNVESELGFFHAYQTRAVSIAGSLGGLDDASGATSLADAAQSKGMIDKDIGALREQLENLLELIARHCSSSADALRTSTRGRVPHPVSEKEGTGSFSSIWKAGMAVEAAGLKGRGGLEGRSWPQQDSVFTHEEKTVEAKPGMSSLLGLQKANGESAELEKSSLIRDTPPQKALPDVPMGDVAGRFVTGTSTSNYSATSSPTREVRLSPVKTGSSHISDQNSSHGVGRAWSIGSSGIPRVLTSVARGKQSFGMKVAVLEARQMPETMDENYLCGCLSLLPQSINDHYDRLEQHLLVPQHRTLPACGTGRVLWEGRRELNFSRSRILYYKHADDVVSEPCKHRFRTLSFV